MSLLSCVDWLLGDSCLPSGVANIFVYKYYDLSDWGVPDHTSTFLCRLYTFSVDLVICFWRLLSAYKQKWILTCCSKYCILISCYLSTIICSLWNYDDSFKTKQSRQDFSSHDGHRCFFSPIINIIVEKHVVKHKQIKQLVKKKKNTNYNFWRQMAHCRSQNIFLRLICFEKKSFLICLK